MLPFRVHCTFFVLIHITYPIIIITEKHMFENVYVSLD